MSISMTKKEIEARAEELNQNKIPFSTKLSPKSAEDLDVILSETGYSKTLAVALALENLRKIVEEKDVQ